jgi:hypothetical protein
MSRPDAVAGAIRQALEGVERDGLLCGHVQVVHARA